MSTTFKIILDTRRMKESSKTFPVKLKVTHNRVQKEFATVFDLSESDYSKLSAARISNDFQVIRDKLREIITKTGVFVHANKPFDFGEFERKFIFGNCLFKERKLKEIKQDKVEQTHPDFDFTPFHKKFPIFTEAHYRPGFISGAFLEYIKRLIQEERIGSALSYQNTYSSLKNFRGNVLFSEITASYLMQYEKWMLGRECSLGTVGINLRALRAIFNEAIENGIIGRENCYPFGKRKYIIPKSINTKKAIGIEAISKLYYHNPTDVNEARAKDYWFFCYMANGMNPKDVAHLKYKNIDGEYFVFKRAKTELATRDNPRPITVYINEDLKEIIARRGNEDQDPDNYIFPILEKEMTAFEKHYTIRTFIKFINDRMKRIGKQLEISNKLTTIVSRHSFSTQLKRSGASTEMIQEALGHTDKATTENYLDSFENDIKKQLSATLTMFKNKPKFL